MKIDLKQMPLSHLKRMAIAGDQILESFRVLGKSQTNVVAQVLAHQGTFYEDEHYPKGDTYDGESGSQYYYHAHRPEAGEHGHFHTFIRAKAIPPAMQPASYPGREPSLGGEDAICHLVAISMDRAGIPIRLFTTNRWVTGETFYNASDTQKLVRRFSVDHVAPCLAMNQWITAMMVLFRPQIDNLLMARDRTIAAHARRHPDSDALEDEALEVTSETPIDIDKQIAAVDRAMAYLKRARG